MAARFFNLFRFPVFLGLFGIFFTGCSFLPPPSVSLEIRPQVELGGFHAVYLDETGQVWTWGDNRFGQLGKGTTSNSSVPQVVSGLPPISVVAAGGGHTLALTTDGTVWGWGGNFDNTLGVSTQSTTQTRPILISGLDHIVAIATGDGQGIALRSDGTVWTWGINTDGQTGLPQTSNHPFPEQVANLDDVIAIAAGDVHTLVLRKDRTVWATGYNGNGQLGDGTTQSRAEFAPVKNLENVVTIDAGEFYSSAVNAYGDVWAWGDNRLGQSGFDPAIAYQAPLPTRITLPQSGEPFEVIAAGGSHVLALNDDGLYSWGYNGFGQLGYETAQTVSPLPEMVPLLQDAQDISASDNNSFILDISGALWVWGDNQFGQLGLGTTEQHTTPVRLVIGEP